MLSTKVRQKQGLEKVISTRVFNPNPVINLNKLTRSLKNIRSNKLKQCFQNKRGQLAIRQPKILRKILTKANLKKTSTPSC